ncbi:MAG: prolyl oligopeptidase family serine peptidase [Pseudomonadota bacterium]
MTRELRLHRKAAAEGTATSLMVFLHGYGADGKDLLGIGDALAPHFPGTAFVAPDAPDPCINNPMGFQWASIPRMDGSSEEDADAAFAASADDIQALLDDLLAEYDLPPTRLILFGFSQGCMLGLHVTPRRAEALGGLIGVSGWMKSPETLAAEATAKPPVLLVHGDMDDVVPIQGMQQAGAALEQAGFTVYGHVMKGTGHGIAPDGIQVAMAFMQDRLSDG